MKKARFISLVCSLTAASWAFPVLAYAGTKYGCSFGGGSWFDGH
jgi:hypothetical protein